MQIIRNLKAIQDTIYEIFLRTWRNVAYHFHLINKLSVYFSNDLKKEKYKKNRENRVNHFQRTRLALIGHSVLLKIQFSFLFSFLISPSLF